MDEKATARYQSGGIAATAMAEIEPEQNVKALA
jgi:hypothetical protein